MTGGPLSCSSTPPSPPTSAFAERSSSCVCVCVCVCVCAILYTYIYRYRYRILRCLAWRWYAMQLTRRLLVHGVCVCTSSNCLYLEPYPQASSPAPSLAPSPLSLTISPLWLAASRYRRHLTPLHLSTSLALFLWRRLCMAQSHSYLSSRSLLSMSLHVAWLECMHACIHTTSLPATIRMPSLSPYTCLESTHTRALNVCKCVRTEISCIC